MNSLRLAGVSLVALLFLVGPGGAQGPGGFGRGGRGGGGGGGGGGPGGGWSMDPNQMFDRMANGKEVWKRSDIADPRTQQRFDRMAEQMGVTNGEITRKQFTDYMSQRMGGRGGPGGGGPGGGQPGGGGNNWESWAESQFRRLDQNGDGFLNNDEMPEELRAERDRWDADHNGLIDLAEFKAYFQARMQQRQADRAALGGDPGAPMVIEVAPPEEEEKRPVVYRAGKLPKELPAWFQQLDTDGDGQVGLYEWKAAGRAVRDFQEMDRNGDGFLTVEEVLAFEAKNKKAGGANGSAGSAAVSSGSNGGSGSAQAGNGRPRPNNSAGGGWSGQRGQRGQRGRTYP